MTGKVILDTDILSEYLKGHNTAVANRAADYAKDHGVFTFTSVTLTDWPAWIEMPYRLRSFPYRW